MKHFLSRTYLYKIIKICFLCILWLKRHNGQCLTLSLSFKISNLIKTIRFKEFNLTNLYGLSNGELLDTNLIII